MNPDEVSINNCSGGVCKLKRKTDAVITLKITPDRESKNCFLNGILPNWVIIDFYFSTVKTLTTNVLAQIGQFPVPFVGVDGQSACNNIFDESGKKASCPLQKGKTYIYKNQFAVLEIYPKLQILVHWALKSGDNTISCFEIPARIV